MAKFSKVISIWIMRTKKVPRPSTYQIWPEDPPSLPWHLQVWRRCLNLGSLQISTNNTSTRMGHPLSLPRPLNKTNISRDFLQKE